MQPLISAHRGGALTPAEQNRRETFERAAQGDADALEFDVHVTRDGVFVLNHDETTTGPDGSMCRISDVTFDEIKRVDADIMTMRDILGIIKAHDKFAHVDFKFTGAEASAMSEITAILPQEQFIITTLEASSLRAIRQSAQTYRSSQLGLSIKAYPQAAMLHPAPARAVARARLAYSCADTVVANQHAARFILADLAVSTDRRLLIWTPDDDDDLREWLSDERVWMLTSNRTERALELRSELNSARAPQQDRG